MTTGNDIFFLTNDLMFGSSVGNVAAQMEKRLRVFSSMNELLKAAPAESPALLLIDLATSGVDVAKAVAWAKSVSATPPEIIAYGPHVHADKLAAAKQAGCDEVLTRGQFHSQMAEIIARY